MSNKGSQRRLSRALAVQTLYQLINRPEDYTVNQALAYTLEAGNYPEEAGDLDDVSYLTRLVNGVVDNQEAIDIKIEEFLTDTWRLDRLAGIDLAILRLGVYEILYEDKEQVPTVVAIDEAVELTKIFSNDQSRKFVNGLLNNLAASQGN